MDTMSNHLPSPSRSGWRVTITGADDEVDPKAMAKLGHEFSFLEWGILIANAGRRGTPRYPSEAWLSRLFRYKAAVGPGVYLRLSAHLCGTVARAVMEGDVPFEESRVERIQLNGFSESNAENLIANTPRTAALILQCRSVADCKRAYLYAEGVLSCHVKDDPGRPVFHYLYDPSGGRGVAQASWPHPTDDWGPLGYAGGIGPDNVRDVLHALRDHTPTWIDMESGVRTGDRLDLGKVRSVCEQVAEWVGPGRHGEVGA